MPKTRIDGEMRPIASMEALTPEDTEGALHQMLDDEAKLDEFAEEHEVDFSYEIPGVARFRINAFQPARRRLDRLPRDPDRRSARSRSSRCPHVIAELAEEERGIVLLTGTTGSGKSTTLAAMIDHINSTTRKHIVTIEDPIEFLHSDKRSLINQREVGMDTASFKRALRRVLRQDPDVILIGEMRDEETVQTALSRRRDRPPRLLDDPHGRRDRVDQPHDRLLPAAPAPAGARDDRRHAQGRRSPSDSCPAADGGRVAVCEILRMTGRVRDMIMDPTQTGQARRGDRRRRLLRHADLRPGALRPRQGRPRHVEDAMRAASQPARLQAADAGRRPQGDDDGADRRGRRDAAATIRRRRSPGVSSRCRRARVRCRSTSVGKVTADGRRRDLPRLPHGGDRLRQVDAAARPRPGRGPLALLRARALARGHQPAHALAAPARARGGGHRRAPHVPRGAAARRVRADREGPRAAADHRGHALVRPSVAGRGRRGRVAATV